MSKLNNFKGSIELISGITQKNNQDFPLIEAHAVQVDESGKRLDEALGSISIDDDTIVDAITSSQDWKDIITKITNNETQNSKNEEEINKLNDRISEFSNDYGVEYIQDSNTLYLFKGESLILPDENGNPGNVVSSTIITGAGGGGSNAAVTSIERISEASQTILYGKPGIIEYRIKSTLSNGEENESPHMVKVYVNDVLCITDTKAVPGRVYSQDVTEFLKSNEENSIRVSATDTETGFTATRRWTISTVEIVLNTNIDTTNAFGKNASIRYEITGNVTKVIHLLLNGEQISETVVSGTTSGVLTVPYQSHGTYNVEIYCTATIGTETITTESIKYEIMFKDSESTAPLIRTTYDGSEVTQYDSFSFNYSIYNPENIDEATVSFSVSWNGEEYTTLNTLKVASNTSYTSPVYDLINHGTLYYKIQCGTTVKLLVITVNSFGVEIEQITNGLAFDFNPTGKSNNSDDYNTYEYNGYSMSINDSFDWVNGGWQLDENGDSCFLIKAGDYIDINYTSLFGALGEGDDEDPKFSGREFKVIYKVSNIYDTTKTFLSCYDDESKIGLRIYPHNAYINSSASELQIPLSEEDIIEFEYNLTSKTSDITMVMPYEDGTPSKPMIYVDSADSFNQRNEQSIHIGSNECDVYIYRLKIYNNFLEDKEILTNFIADGRTGKEKASRYTRNQIYDINNKLTPESVAAACPDLRVIAIEAPIFTADKKEKIENTKVTMIYKNGDAVLDNWVAENCIHNGQGTSSNEYGYSGRNIDINLKVKEVRNKIYNINKTAWKDEDGLVEYSYGDIVTEKDAIYVDRYPVSDLSTIGTEQTHLETTVETYTVDGVLKPIGSTVELTSELYDSMDNGTRVRVNIPDVTVEVTTYTATQIVYDDAGLPIGMGTVLPSDAEVYLTNDLSKKQLLDDITKVTAVTETYKPATKITLGDGTTTKKVSLTRDSVPNNYFNIKVNIASSENANNALLQKRFERYIPYTSYAKQQNSKVKNSMEFFNCVVFIKETNPDVKTHREFNDNEFHFYAIGNIGDSKKTDSTRVADSADDKEFTLEITDWNNYLSSFPVDTMIECPKDFLLKENIGVFYELIDGEYVLTEDTEINQEKTYYIDALENEPYDDTWTYDIRYSTETDASLENIKKTWKEFYRFVTRDLTTNGVEDPAKVAQWKEEFKDWFILDSALYHYLFTLRYTMVDNRAKNTFWHYGKCTDGKYRFDLWDYDNDTALGINNAGKLTMTYGVEDTDADEGGVDYFRGSTSTFFCRVRDYFSKELINMYKSVNTACFSSASLIEEYDTWQSQFPEELWRLDYERKYKRTYLGGYGAAWDNAVPPSQAGKGADTSFLIDMMNGRKKYQRRQFERDQDFYMASKFISTTNYNDSVMLRCTNPIGVNPAPNYTINITPYMNMYVNLYNNTDNYYYHERCEAGKTYTVPYPADVADFIYIRGASKIQSFGDLSLLYLQQALLGSAEKLKDLIIGNESSTYSNPSLTTLEFKSNPLLEKIDIRNTSFASPLDLTTLQHLKELYTEGSNVTAVSFANNGILEIAKLNAVSSLNMKNLLFIKDFTLESYDNLTSLFYENCYIDKDQIDEVSGTRKVYDLGLSIINSSPNLNRLRITNVDWDYNHTYNWNSDVTILERLTTLNGFTATGANQTKSVVTGRALVNYLTESRKRKFQEAWNGALEVSLAEGGVYKEEVTVKFLGEDGTVLYSVICDKDSKITDPVENGLMEAPTKESTAQYSYTFSGWNWDFGDPVRDNMSISPKFSETVRSYVVRWYAMVGDEAPLAQTTVLYGSNVNYDDVAKKSGAELLPSRPSNGTDYYIFDGWQTNSFYITGNTNIYAKWISGSYNKDKDLSEMNPAEIKAMVMEERVIAKLGDSAEQTGSNKVNIQLGYMPTYSDIQEQVLVSDKLQFNAQASEVMNTGVNLLAEDKSWTLAIDFEFEYNQNASPTALSILAGCYDATSSNGYGFALANVNNGNPKIYWGANSYSIDVGVAPKIVETMVPQTSIVGLKTLTSQRDIVVIRHVKGDSNLYVYSNARFDNSEVKETKLTRTTVQNPISSPLSIGGAMTSTGSITKNSPACGKIHYMKLWEGDLGTTECKKIAVWTYNKQSFQYYGPNLYYQGESGDANVHASFIAENLLDGTHILTNTNSTTGGFANTSLDEWLQNKFYPALPPSWRQLIVKTRIKNSTGYDANKVAQQQPLTETVYNTYYVFIPSRKDIDSSAITDGEYDGEPYISEGAQFSGTQTSISWFVDGASRIKYMGNGEMTFKQIDVKTEYSGIVDRTGEPIPKTWYTSTPDPFQQQPQWFKVWEDIEDEQWDGSVLTYHPTQYQDTGGNVEFGICPCFSI